MNLFSFLAGIVTSATAFAGVAYASWRQSITTETAAREAADSQRAARIIDYLQNRHGPRREAYSALSQRFRKFQRAMESCHEQAQEGNAQGLSTHLPSYPQQTDEFELAVINVQLEGPGKVSRAALNLSSACIQWYDEMREWEKALRGDPDANSEPNYPFLVEVAGMEAVRKYSEFMDAASGGLNEDDSDPDGAL
ncbi:hypothetical protein [Streptomyces sp. DSM 15324]|uniref:hypothetical protein n=1 Tax=Streptomyces sp. DSM 15324 TaxID=1739111 RepID=UPI00131C1944|nr:hypothetical protein [Streptomyces sp. DSM 15324]